MDVPLQPLSPPTHACPGVCPSYSGYRFLSIHTSYILSSPWAPTTTTHSPLEAPSPRIPLGVVRGEGSGELGRTRPTFAQRPGAASWASLEVVEAVGGAALPPACRRPQCQAWLCPAPPPFPHPAPSSPRPARPWGDRGPLPRPLAVPCPPGGVTPGRRPGLAGPLSRGRTKKVEEIPWRLLPALERPLLCPVVPCGAGEKCSRADGRY